MSKVLTLLQRDYIRVGVGGERVLPSLLLCWGDLTASREHEVGTRC